MPDEKQCPPKRERQQGLFRRAEDWERLTRLEFLVEELARDNDRRDTRIDRIVQTQKEVREDMDQIKRYARDMRMLMIGGVIVLIGSAYGWDKVLGLLNLLIPGG